MCWFFLLNPENAFIVKDEACMLNTPESLTPVCFPSLPIFLCHLVAMDTETSPSHLQTKAYVRQLQVIDNQNLLFDMSCKLEAKDT